MLELKNELLSGARRVPELDVAVHGIRSGNEGVRCVSQCWVLRSGVSSNGNTVSMGPPPAGPPPPSKHGETPVVRGSQASHAGASFKRPTAAAEVIPRPTRQRQLAAQRQQQGQHWQQQGPAAGLRQQQAAQQSPPRPQPSLQPAAPGCPWMRGQPGSGRRHWWWQQQQAQPLPFWQAAARRQAQALARPGPQGLASRGTGRRIAGGGGALLCQGCQCRAPPRLGGRWGGQACVGAAIAAR